ncbi:MAG: hypothetical protein HC807_05845, partial [Gammaproteobacteria bacterium]|nr:hypothetical protein [Gammaproteobacteria bacterium]
MKFSRGKDQLIGFGENMPLDLLVRWPRQTPWHQWLVEQEQESLRSWAETLPQLLVFFLREDVTEQGLEQAAEDLLREKFSILAVQQLSSEQTQRVMRQVRGGNWLQYGKSVVVPPKIAVVCYDMQPQCDGLEEAAARANRKSVDAFPFV